MKRMLARDSADAVDAPLGVPWGFRVAEGVDRRLDRYGGSMTQAQVAERLGITRGAVSMAERSALAKLRPLLLDLPC